MTTWIERAAQKHVQQRNLEWEEDALVTRREQADALDTLGMTGHDLDRLKALARTGDALIALANCDSPEIEPDL